MHLWRKDDIHLRLRSAECPLGRCTGAILQRPGEFLHQYPGEWRKNYLWGHECQITVQIRRRSSNYGRAFFRGIQKMPEIQANRNFLAQLYHSLDLQIANTFFAQPADRLVTYFEIAASAMDEIKDNKFAQMDFIVCGSTCTTDMTDIYSMRHLAFASHHFLL